MSFIAKADLLTFSQNFQELKLKDYRNLIKCFLGDEIDPNSVFTNTDAIIQKTCNLKQEEIDQINFIDYLLLLLNIRSASIGNSISLYIQNDESTHLKIILSVENIIDTILNSIPISIFNPIQYNNITTFLQIPTLKEIFQFERQNLNINTILINRIKFETTEIYFKSLTLNDREEIIKSLPIKLTSLLEKNISLFLNSLNNINLLESVNTEEFDKILPMTLNSQILAFILKLIFNTDLESIYTNLFILSKGANLDCNFLDNCSPGEFYLFTKKFEELHQVQQQASENTSVENNLPPINSEFEVE